MNGLQHNTSNANGLQYGAQMGYNEQYEKLQWFTQTTRTTLVRWWHLRNRVLLHCLTNIKTGHATAGKQALGSSSEPEYCLDRRRKSSPKEPTINWALCMVGGSLTKRTQFPRWRVRGTLSTTLGTKVHEARFSIMCKQVALQRNDSCILSYTNSPACYVSFQWQRPITLFQVFYVRNSSQIRTKSNSVFCGVQILVISCQNGLLIPVQKPLPETLGAWYVPEFRIFRILEW